MATAPAKQKSGFPWFKTIRWTFLAILIIVVMVMLKKPVPPAPFVQVPPQVAAASAASFDSKLNELERAREGGYAAEVRLSSEELNSAFQRSQGQLPQASAPSSGNVSPAVPAPSQQPEEAPPQVKSMQFTMLGDQVVVCDEGQILAYNLNDRPEGAQGMPVGSVKLAWRHDEEQGGGPQAYRSTIGVPRVHDRNPGPSCSWGVTSGSVIGTP